MLFAHMIPEGCDDLCRCLFRTPVLGEEKHSTTWGTLIGEILAAGAIGHTESGRFVHMNTNVVVPLCWPPVSAVLCHWGYLPPHVTSCEGVHLEHEVRQILSQAKAAS